MMLDFGEIVPEPDVEFLEAAQGIAAQFSRLVFDAWRNFGKIVARDEAVALEIAQSKRQHALGDSVDLSLQGGKAKPVSFGERKAPQDRNGPFVAEERTYAV